MARSKSLSDKQLAANRRNAQLSTGPRTPEGKARSRWNALKHGALSQAVIPPPLELYESRPEFARLHETLHEDLQPGSAIEELLVESIVTLYWRLARVYRAEAAAIAEAQERVHDHLEDHRKWKTLLADLSRLNQTYQGLVKLSASTQAMRDHLRSRSGDPRWESASDEELKEAFEEELISIEEELARIDAREEDIERQRRSVPSIDETLKFARYEAHLERQIFRALNELERLQRLRLGQAVPPPLSINVGVEGEGHEK